MIVQGSVPGPLHRVLAAISEELEATADARSPQLWLIGPPPAGLLSTIAAWTGPVLMLKVGSSAWWPQIEDRADVVFRFAVDHPDGAAQTLVGMPAPLGSCAVAPPSLGEPLGALWQRRLMAGRPLPEGLGLTWISGGGAQAAAAAAAAWTRGRCVIRVREAKAGDRESMPGIVSVGTALEADELTSFLAENPALIRLLAAQGQRAHRALPTPQRVADSMRALAALGERASAL